MLILDKIRTICQLKGTFTHEVYEYQDPDFIITLRYFNLSVLTRSEYSLILSYSNELKIVYREWIILHKSIYKLTDLWIDGEWIKKIEELYHKTVMEDLSNRQSELDNEINKLYNL